MTIRIIPDFIPAGSRNIGNPMVPKYITVHSTGNLASTANAAMHGRYLRGDAIAREVSWHFTVDDHEIRQHLPRDVNGWHASDGYGPGNTASIAIEICEYEGIDQRKADNLAAMLCAHLIATVTTLHPFPECVTQHHTWARDKKNCPRHLRLPGKWDAFLDVVKARMGPPPWNPADEIDRLMQRGILNTRHNPNAIPNYGELATIVNRILDHMEG
jgi:N-acetylmuramoyl-L-alanine amidase